MRKQRLARSPQKTTEGAKPKRRQSKCSSHPPYELGSSSGRVGLPRKFKLRFKRAWERRNSPSALSFPFQQLRQWVQWRQDRNMFVYSSHPETVNKFSALLNKKQPPAGSSCCSRTPLGTRTDRVSQQQHRFESGEVGSSSAIYYDCTGNSVLSGRIFTIVRHQTLRRRACFRCCGRPPPRRAAPRRVGEVVMAGSRYRTEPFEVYNE